MLDQNQNLLLNKTDPGLDPLRLFFDLILKKESFLVSNASQQTLRGNTIEISGQTTDWGDEISQAFLTYTSDGNGTSNLTQLKLVKPSNDLSWFALPNVNISDLEQHFHINMPENDQSLATLWQEIQGKMDVGNSIKIPFKISNPASSQRLIVESAFSPSEAPGLTDLANLFGNQNDPERDLAWLPDNFKDEKLITLRDIALRIEPNSDIQLTSISTMIDILPGHLWPIVPGVSFLAVGDLWFALEVDYPLEPEYRFPIFTIGGTIQIGAPGTQDGRINLTARWPDWAINGQLEKGSEIKLGQLLQEITLPADQLPTGENALVIDKLRFSAEPTNDPKEFTFFIAIDNVWKLQLSPNATFEIEELSLGLNYQGQPPESTENGVTGQFVGKISLSDVGVTLLAAYGGASAGWTFSGETGKGQKIPLGQLITDELAPKFGDFTPPAPIAGLEIENLATSFNTASNDFTFSGETVLPVARRSTEQIDFKLNIELKNQSNGSYTKRFDGLLTVKDLSFEVLFDSVRQISAVGEQGLPNDSQTFLAIFQNQLGRSIAVNELLSPLGINVRTRLSFTVKEALLGYQKTSSSSDTSANVPSTTNGKWLFGINIEGGINLSAIHIDALPFVSIPPNQTLKLDFQVLAASTPFEQTEIDALSALAPSGSLTFPSKRIERVDLSVTLDFGNGRKAVDLPIGLQTGTGGNGLANQGNNTVSTPQNGSGVAVAGQDGIRWITLQKQLGPLAFERVGVKYEDQQVSALLDASFSAGGLTISLNGLRMTSPISQFNPSFGLDGLGIDFRNASIEIGGTFLKEENGFAGLAVIRTEALSLSAIGAYAYADGAPSLFIYAVLDYPIGGPAFFYVTGVAAGFGYNRRLVMPDIESVATFPLVQEATGTATPPAGQSGAASVLPTSQAGRANRLQQEIHALSTAIPIENGQYFLAVGLKFTSFKQIDSFALLAVQFGNRFEIDLLGLSTLKAPAPIGAETVTPVAEAQLALKAVFIPSEGFLGVRAQLTSNSYILSRACRLTGGFAFYSWFSGENEGDFVLTLGGYHPAFKVPAHYPTVPRLGFMWQVTNNFYLRGGLYFALTAHALMAGGKLEAVYQSDNIRAWFKAGADFLIAWKPYHYEIEVFVSLGLEITVKFFGTHTITLSADANLKLWGPEFGGEAHVKVKVLIFKIPVDISFGSHARAIPAITFDEFKQTYLPAKPEEMCSVAIKSGLSATVTENDQEIWIVNAKEMVLVTNSTIPSHKSRVFGQDYDWDGGIPALQPMGVNTDEVTTTHSVTFDGVSNSDLESLAISPITKKMPAAIWGRPILSGNDPIRHVGGQRYVEKPQLNGNRFVDDTLTGYEIRVGRPPESGATRPVPTSVLRSEIETAGEIPSWRQFALDGPSGTAAWQAAARSEKLVHNLTRDEILAALGMAQLDIDYGEPVTDHVIV